MTLDTGRKPLILQLGGLTLDISDYTMKTEVPVLHDTLCDGSPEYRLLTALPCLLRLTGTVLQTEGGTYLAALQSALRTHRQFETEFDGVSFTGLQITSAECSGTDHGRSAELTLNMIGGIAL